MDPPTIPILFLFSSTFECLSCINKEVHPLWNPFFSMTLIPLLTLPNVKIFRNILFQAIQIVVSIQKSRGSYNISTYVSFYNTRVTNLFIKSKYSVTSNKSSLTAAKRIESLI